MALLHIVTEESGSLVVDLVIPQLSPTLSLWRRLSSTVAVVLRA